MILRAVGLVVGSLLFSSLSVGCGGPRPPAAARSVPSLEPTAPAPSHVTTTTESPPKDRWAAMPPLVGEGRILYQAEYDVIQDGARTGGDRVAVGVVDGGMTIAGQMITEVGEQFELSYRLLPSSATVSVKDPSG